MSRGTSFPAVCLVPGEASGPLALLTHPLSLWGGFDPHTGRVTDENHPQCGLQIGGRVLLMPGGRGSSSSSSVLLESARLQAHPSAIVLVEPDPILVVGALVAADLYDVHIPVVSVAAAVLARFEGAAEARVDARPGHARVGFL
ncbi:MAG: DUF126 domain-containing protein [Xanthomonadales bacterium]|nr:DUF126 domain-containing protein [Gammaproteobacteria bacterium]MBT8056431.1 DUF126 domain-containing protein [Gammaproteobacteria bacterium]NNL05039.1 DUF126 domain-containing protein [Xanthomonadales bacterium]